MLEFWPVSRYHSKLSKIQRVGAGHGSSLSSNRETPDGGQQRFHANNKTKRRFLPNLQRRRFWLESENRWINLRLSNAALRTIDKNGIDVVVAELRARGQAV